MQSLDKVMKSLKVMLQSQVSKLSEISDCLKFLRHLFIKCEMCDYVSMKRGASSIKMKIDLP